ncbi:MAG: endolytic transglycosylase MltG, partial [Oscillospiraceae bacterium]|nr:endolytic transglycosylase MltG [Oscillospiraceae bacterium]
MALAYDTYKTKWYTPGAICNPGLNAIKAVLYPADTNYYFFCADTRTDEKIVYYAETDEQHDQNRILAGLA